MHSQETHARKNDMCMVLYTIHAMEANAEINDEPRDDGEEIFSVRQNGMFAILVQDKQESFALPRHPCLS